jgi:hypothetical protein
MTTGTRAPVGAPSLDSSPLPTVPDLAIARIGLLQAIDQRQHAMATIWGGPPTWNEMLLIGGATGVLRVQVPPKVTHVQVGALAMGDGKLTFTSAVDVAGVVVEIPGIYGTVITPSLASAVVVWGSEQVNDGAAGEARALKVRTAPGWTWATIEVTIACATNITTGTELWGVYFRPLHVVQTGL